MRKRVSLLLLRMYPVYVVSMEQRWHQEDTTDGGTDRAVIEVWNHASNPIGYINLW